MRWLFIALLILFSIMQLPSHMNSSRGFSFDVNPRSIYGVSGGFLEGIVKDTYGRPIYNAYVELYNSTYSIGTYTSVTGLFRISLAGVTPGMYSFRVRKFGYRDLNVSVKVYASMDSIAIVGDYNSDLLSLFEPLGYRVDTYSTISSLRGNVYRYKAIILNDLGDNHDPQDLVAVMDEAVEWNTTLVFLDSWESSTPDYWHSLYALYEYSSTIESAGYPAPDEREDHYPYGEYVEVKVLDRNHPIFTGVIYDIDQERGLYYLGSALDDYMDYAIDRFIDDNGVTVLAEIVDSYNSVTGPCIVEYRRETSSPWYYLSAAASFYWVGYGFMGADNQYSVNSRKVLVNTILYTTGFINSSIIEGYVYNSTSGEPVANATVEIVELGLKTNTTSNGTFVFTGVNPGTYTLSVKRSGYYPYSQSVNMKIGGVTRVEVGLLTRGRTSWLVLVYLDGDNNLEDAAIEDFNEMEEIGSNNGVEIVVLLDRIPGYDSSNGDWTGTRLYHVIHDEDTGTINSEQLQLWTGSYEEELNMGDPQTLKNFIEYVYNLYGGEHIALILWNHGSGFYGSSLEFTPTNIAYDDTDDDSLDEAEIRNVLEELNSTGIHIDLLAMDACLMGMIEITYEYTGLVDVLVASEETEPGDGYEYNYWLDDLVDNPGTTPQELGEILVQAYSERYSGSSDVTSSATDLNILYEKVIPVLDEFSQYVIDNMGSLSSVLQQARDNAQAFYYSSFKDLVDFMEKVKSYTSDLELIELANNVIGNVSEAVIAEWHSSDLRANGLSIWFPSQDTWDSYNYQYLQLRFASETLWDNLLETYFNSGGQSIDTETRTPTRSVGKASRYLDWGNAEFASTYCITTDSRILYIEPKDNAGIVKITVSGGAGILYVEPYNTSDPTALSAYNATASEPIDVYIEPGTYILKVYVKGGEPALYRITASPMKPYDIVYQYNKLHIALVGGDSTLIQYLTYMGFAVDSYSNYTMLVNFTGYSAIVINKWADSIPPAEDIARFMEWAVGNSTSIVLLDTVDRECVSGGCVAFLYKNELRQRNIPIPQSRSIDTVDKAIKYIVEYISPVNDPYIPGDKLVLVNGGEPSSLVYYSNTGNGSIVGAIEYNEAVLGAGIVIYRVNYTYITYIAFGASGINPGEVYSSGYSATVKQLVYSAIASSATTQYIEVPIPVPEDSYIPFIPGIAVAVAVIVLVARSIITSNRRE